MQNGRDALVASAYGTWNNVEHRGHSIQRHAPMPFDGARSRQARPSRAPMPFDGARSRQARPSRATIPEDKREGRACRVRLRNVEHRGHPIQHHAQRAFDGARSRQARPSRATIPEDKREGRACRVRLRNVEHRGHPIQHHAQRAFDGARSRQARPSRAEGVRWGTVATSATLPATIPEDKREGRACRVRLRNVASARATRLGKPHATRLGQKTKPDANTHLAERDWRREGDLNPRYGD